MLQVSEDKVTRWHPNFDVDNVPDVPAGNIPLPPEIKTFSTAKDVLGIQNKSNPLNF
jgi:chromatin licensing and DNA replication factor 1